MREPRRSYTSLPDGDDFVRLRRQELPWEAEQLARFLIGMLIVSDIDSERTVVRITETEAYLPHDAAAHSFRGRTSRNASLFLDVGHAYVYFIYGNHYCLNVSAEPAGIGAGVLLRAAHIVEGVDLVRIRRGASKERDLLRGPGRLARGLAVTLACDGLDLTVSERLWLARGTPAVAIGESVRIGITKETGRLLRYYERGSRYVSGPAWMNT